MFKGETAVLTIRSKPNCSLACYNNLSYFYDAISTKNNMPSNTHGFSWVPRILCILIIIFLGVFASDAFVAEHSMFQQVSDFLIHLVPSLILLLLLIIAWKRELIGGILFTILSLVMSPFLYSMNYEQNHNIFMSLGVILIIALPILLTGILFIISYSKRKPTAPPN